jgi:hypothetical protein
LVSLSCAENAHTVPVVQELLNNGSSHGAGGAGNGKYGHDDYLL